MQSFGILFVGKDPNLVLDVLHETSDDQISLVQMTLFAPIKDEARASGEDNMSLFVGQTTRIC